MKYTDSEGQEVDTDKMPDMEAEVVERQKLFYDWMVEHKIPMLVLTMVPVGIKSRVNTAMNVFDQEGWTQLMMALDTFLQKMNLTIRRNDGEDWKK